jgi:D-hydroxyproline dehydrogenase
MKTAIVIGQGLVGACVALALQRAGLSVTIIDAGDEKAAASFGNAGHLAIEQTSPLASRANVLSLHRRIFTRGGPAGFPLRDISAWLPFGLKLLGATGAARFARGQHAMQSLLGQAIPAWQRLAARVQATHLIRTDGHWVVWESAASAQLGYSAWQAANTGAATIAMASASDLAALRAGFGAQPVAAARFTGTGQVVDLQALRQALQTAFLVAGGTLKHGRVRDAAQDVTMQDGAVYRADTIVVTAGIGASQILKRKFGSIALIAERGYHIEAAMDARSATPQGLPVVFEDRNIILAPFASSLRLSGFTEFSNASSPPDERKWQKLQMHAHALGLPIPAKHDRWIGSRPTLPDYLPAIGRHPQVRSLFYAFGHNHLGVTLAATTGELMAALVQNSVPSIDLTPFDLKRFQ